MGVKSGLRIALPKDLTRIVEIDQKSYLVGCTPKSICRVLENNKRFGYVAYSGAEIVGYLVYQAYPDHIKIIRLAIDEEHRRKGFGSMILKKMKSKMGVLRRRIELIVKESNTPAQLFLRANGFSVKNTLKKYYKTYHDDLPCVPYEEDGYLFSISID